MTGWLMLGVVLLAMLLAWALVAVGTSGDDDGYRPAQPRRRWRVPFRLTPSEREFNRLRYRRWA